MRIMTKAVLATLLTATTAPAIASTLVLYDLDAVTGRRLAMSPYADQDVARMEKQGLIRGYPFQVNDDGTETLQSAELISPPPMLPTAGVRNLVGRVTWEVTTQMSDGRLRYRNLITSEQGFSNGQGPLADYRRSEVTVSGEVAGVASNRPIVTNAYTNNRGNRMMIGFLYP